MITAISVPSLFLVLFGYRRARTLFFLSDERYAPARSARKDDNSDLQGNFSFEPTDHAGYGNRLSEIARDLDNRNAQSFMHRGTLRSSQQPLDDNDDGDRPSLDDLRYLEQKEQLQQDPIAKVSTRLVRSRYMRFMQRMGGKSREKLAAPLAESEWNASMGSGSAATSN